MTSSPNTCEAETRPEYVDATCDEHGEYRARRMIMPITGSEIIESCPECAEERRKEAKEREELQMQQARNANIASMLARSLIPRRFREKTLDTYRANGDGQRRALGIARKFVENFGSDDTEGASLIFAGKPGTGKTHLACGIGLALIRKGCPAVFGTVLTVVRHVKDTYRRDSERTEADSFRDLLEPELLIIDEVGAQIGSEHELMILFEIINSRYQECRSTILISNLTRSELTEFMGDRVIDRFDECGAVLGFDWPSYRRAGK